jgi:hypothetical protein
MCPCCTDCLSFESLTGLALRVMYASARQQPKHTSHRFNEGVTNAKRIPVAEALNLLCPNRKTDGSIDIVRSIPLMAHQALTKVRIQDYAVVVFNSTYTPYGVHRVTISRDAACHRPFRGLTQSRVYLARQFVAREPFDQRSKGL